MTNRDLIITELRKRANLDDDELAKRIGKDRHMVNQECRLLAQRGVIIREPGGPRGKLVNRLIDSNVISVMSPQTNQFRSIPSQRTKKTNAILSGGSADLKIDSHTFERVLQIEPLCNGDGTILPVLPQNRYHNNNNLGLHKYGQGPFCKFKIPAAFQQAGVYAISIDGHVKYVGECESLSSRFNMGYGIISPRNCFNGGQQTNCRINTLIYHAAVEGRKIILWFHRATKFKQIEQDLRNSLKPEWNLI